MSKDRGVCPHGHSKGWCGDPACIPFNAGLRDEKLDIEQTLEEYEEDQLRYGKLPPP